MDILDQSPCVLKSNCVGIRCDLEGHSWVKSQDLVTFKSVASISGQFRGIKIDLRELAVLITRQIGEEEKEEKEA